MSRLIPDAEEVPAQYSYAPIYDPGASGNHIIIPTNHMSQLSLGPTPQFQGNPRSLTGPQSLPYNFPYQPQNYRTQMVPSYSGIPVSAVPTHLPPETMETQMGQRDEFGALIQEIVNVLSQDSKVMSELKFIFSDRFSQQELDKIPDVQSFISKMMENNLLSENNVKYLEDYLRETTYEKLSNKLIKFRQSSDSAVRPTPHNPPTVAKQAQVPQRVEERPVSNPQPQPQLQQQLQQQPPPQLVFSIPRPPSEAAMYYYPMDKRPHGVCAIFNIQNFTAETLGKRKGSDIDRDRLELMFQHLKYSVEVYNDLTADGLLSKLGEISQRDHNNFDSFICCILTHGADNDALYGSDGVEVNIRKVMSLFYGNKARSLFGKPKIFFIQACRGDLEDTGSEFKGLEKKNTLMEDSQQVHTGYHFDSVDLPDTADFLIAFPTSSGYVSWRSHNEGTWYIKALCEQLEQCHDHYDLMTILTMVNGQVAMKKTTEGYKQMPAPVTHLRKLMYIHS